MIPIETFESRRLFAVVVSQGFPGFYEVTGDAADDVITISIDQAARTFSLDGVVYGGVSAVNVYGNGGNDTVSIDGINGVAPIGASVLGGDGNDTITINNVGTAVWGGFGDDRLEFNDSYRAEAYGEDGLDQITLKGACLDAEVHGGPGNDTIVATGSTVPVFLYGDDGWDRLYGSPFGDVLDGGLDRDMMFGNGGNDQFYARDGSLDWIVGGDGIDTAVTDENEMTISGTEVVLST